MQNQAGTDLVAIAIGGCDRINWNWNVYGEYGEYLAKH